MKVVDKKLTDIDCASIFVASSPGINTHFHVDDPFPTHNQI